MATTTTMIIDDSSSSSGSESTSPPSRSSSSSTSSSSSPSFLPIASSPRTSISSSDIASSARKRGPFAGGVYLGPLSSPGSLVHRPSKKHSHSNSTHPTSHKHRTTSKKSAAIQPDAAGSAISMAVRLEVSDSNRTELHPASQHSSSSDSSHGVVVVHLRKPSVPPVGMLQDIMDRGPSTSPSASTSHASQDKSSSASTAAASHTSVDVRTSPCMKSVVLIKSRLDLLPTASPFPKVESIDALDSISIFILSSPPPAPAPQPPPPLLSALEGPSSAIAVEPLARKPKRTVRVGKRSSCHYDRLTSDSPKMRCSTSTCKYQWCEACLTRHFPKILLVPFTPESRFICPACLNICTCARCRRSNGFETLAPVRRIKRRPPILEDTPQVLRTSTGRIRIATPKALSMQLAANLDRLEVGAALHRRPRDAPKPRRTVSSQRAMDVVGGAAAALEREMGGGAREAPWISADTMVDNARKAQRKRKLDIIAVALDSDDDHAANGGEDDDENASQAYFGFDMRRTKSTDGTTPIEADDEERDAMEGRPEDVRVTMECPSSGRTINGATWCEGPKRRKRRKLGSDFYEEVDLGLEASQEDSFVLDTAPSAPPTHPVLSPLLTDALSYAFLASPSPISPVLSATYDSAQPTPHPAATYFPFLTQLSTRLKSSRITTVDPTALTSNATPADLDLEPVSPSDVNRPSLMPINTARQPADDWWSQVESSPFASSSMPDSIPSYSTPSSSVTPLPAPSARPRMSKSRRSFAYEFDAYSDVELGAAMRSLLRSDEVVLSDSVVGSYSPLWAYSGTKVVEPPACGESTRSGKDDEEAESIFSELMKVGRQDSLCIGDTQEEAVMHEKEMAAEGGAVSPAASLSSGSSSPYYSTYSASNSIASTYASSASPPVTSPFPIAKE